MVKIQDCCFVVLPITVSYFEILDEALLPYSLILKCCGVYKKTLQSREGLKRDTENDFGKREGF